jgi:hypothetical protein
VTYPLAKIREESAFIAYHLHWILEDILALPHRERVAWVGQVSAMNKKVLESES